MLLRERTSSRLLSPCGGDIGGDAPVAETKATEASYHIRSQLNGRARAARGGTEKGAVLLGTAYEVGGDGVRRLSASAMLCDCRPSITLGSRIDRRSPSRSRAPSSQGRWMGLSLRCGQMMLAQAL